MGNDFIPVPPTPKVEAPAAPAAKGSSAPPDAARKALYDNLRQYGYTGPGEQFNSGEGGGKGALESLGTGAVAAAEGLGRGVATQGFSTAEKALGVDPAGIEARRARFPILAGTSEMVGETARVIGTTAAVGPAALYLNAAANIAGRSADYAYDHDGRLGVETIGRYALEEGLGVAGGFVLGRVAGGIAKNGKKLAGWASGKLGESLENTLSKKALSSYAGRGVGSRLADIADEAAQRGLFTGAKKEAVQKLKYERNMLKDTLSSIETQVADRVGTVGGGQTSQPIVNWMTDVQTALRAYHEDTLGAGKTASKYFRGQFKDMSNASLIDAKRLFNFERVVTKKGNSLKGDGYVYGAFVNLKKQIGEASDKLLMEGGQAPQGYRNLAADFNYVKDQYFKNSRLLDVAEQVPRVEVSGKKLASKIGVGLAIDYGLRAAGVSPGLAHLGTVATVGGLTGNIHAGANAAVALVRQGRNAALQSISNNGKALQSFESQVLPVLIANQQVAEIKNGVSRIAAGAGYSIYSEARKLFKDDERALHNVTAYSQTPAPLDSQTATELQNSVPMPHAVGAHQVMQRGLQYAYSNVPARVTQSQALSVPASRTLNQYERKTWGDVAFALRAPLAAMAYPTADTAAAVKTVYPGFYQAYVKEVLSQVGPNMPVSHPLRRTLRVLGLDTDTAALETLSQVALQATPRPPPGASRSTQHGRTTSEAPSGATRSQTLANR